MAKTKRRPFKVSAEALEEDAALRGMTIAQAIEAHDAKTCDEPVCKVCAALRYVAVCRKSSEPWKEVLALHVHNSFQAERIIIQDVEEKSIRSFFSLALFDLVQRLGGIAFIPKLQDIADRPGHLHVECLQDGGRVLKVAHEAEDRKKLH